MKKHFSTIILCSVFFIGLSLMLYPTFSDWWNSFHQSRAIHDYHDALSDMDEEDYSAECERAKEYNSQLFNLQYPLIEYERISGYEEILDVTENGIMGYISIEKIGVELPVYHGTTDGVLQVAVGHMEGTSLPVGGESTHSVFSAHRGLPSARLFTDLDRLVEGDIFTITVLGEILTYEVDQILIVEPLETEALNITEGKDYCTLITCTPYGINTHRMLVRGHRVEGENAKGRFIAGDAYQIDPVLIAPVIAAPVLLFLLLTLIFPKKRKTTQKTKLLRGESMTDKELRKLKRIELLELLIEQAKENEQLKQQVFDLEKQLSERDTQTAQMEIIAETTARMNEMFETAQAAAEQCLNNMRKLEEQQQKRLE